MNTNNLQNRGREQSPLMIGLMLILLGVCILIVFPSPNRKRSNTIKRQCEELRDKIERDINDELWQMPRTYIYGRIECDSQGKPKSYKICYQDDNEVHECTLKRDPENGEFYRLQNEDDMTKLCNLLCKDTANLFANAKQIKENEYNAALNNKDTISAKATALFNFLMGNSERIYVYGYESDTLHCITVDHMPQYYIDWNLLDTMSYKCHKNKELLLFDNLSNFLTQHNVLSKTNFKAVAINYRDNEFYIQGEENSIKFSKDKFYSRLQKDCIQKPMILISDTTIISWDDLNTNLTNSHKVLVSPTLLSIWENTDYQCLKTKVPGEDAKNNYWITILIAILCMLIGMGVITFYIQKRQTLSIGNKGFVPQEEVEKAKKEAERAKEEAKMAKKEVEIAKKEVEIAKREALKDRKEALKVKEEAERVNREAEKFRRIIEELKETIKSLTEKITIMQPYYQQLKKVMDIYSTYFSKLKDGKEILAMNRILLMQITMKELALPLINKWMKNHNLPYHLDDVDTVITNLSNGLFQHALVRYMESAYKTPNISIQDFTKRLEEDITKSINEYRTSVPEGGIKALPLDVDSTFVERKNILLQIVAILRTDKKFKTVLWEKFGQEFAKQADTCDNQSWYLEQVLNIALFTTDYLSFANSGISDTSYFYNLEYLMRDFDTAYPKKFEYNNYEHSTTYTNRMYEWCKQLGIKQLKALVGQYKIQ